MLVAPAHTHRRRRTPHATVPRDRTFPVPNPAKGTGGDPWVVDWARARADAQAMLDAIDFSRRDIVIYGPGTSCHGPHPDFAKALAAAQGGGDASLVAIEYESTWHLRRSLSTGIATLKLVLEAIRARGGHHRILMAGESQGAWAIGEVLADPEVGPMVDRALLMGHPWLALHQYDAGQDPRVRVINHDGDLVAMPVHGDPTVGVDAVIGVRTLQLGKLGSIVRGFLANPRQGVEMLKGLLRVVPLLKRMVADPHVYAMEMPRAVQYLLTGALPEPAASAP